MAGPRRSPKPVKVTCGRSFLRWLVPFVIATVWGVVLYLGLGNDAAPGGVVFAFWLLFVVAFCVGSLFRLAKVPAAIGMLLAGFALRNIPGRPLDGIRSDWSAVIRACAAAVFLFRVGLSLDVRLWRRIAARTAVLAIVPLLVEAIAVAFIVYGIVGLPASWSFVLGFAVAAVSHDVISPTLQSLQKRGLGTEKGLAAMLTTSSGLDNLLAVIGCGFAIGFIFLAQSAVPYRVFRGPLETAIAIVVAIPVGYACKLLLSVLHNVRFAALGGLCFGAVLAGLRFGFFGAGAVFAVIIGVLVASTWRVKAMRALTLRVTRAWSVGEPVLFSCVGATITIEMLSARVVGLGAVALLCGLFLRLLVVFFALRRSLFSYSERAFILVSWTPKSTFQVIFGAVGLDMMLALGGAPEDVANASAVLVLSALSMLLTAPLAHFIVHCFGHRMLEATPPEWSSGDDRHVVTTELHSASRSMEGDETAGGLHDDSSPPETEKVVSEKRNADADAKNARLSSSNWGAAASARTPREEFARGLKTVTIPPPMPPALSSPVLKDGGYDEDELIEEEEELTDQAKRARAHRNKEATPVEASGGWASPHGVTDRSMLYDARYDYSEFYEPRAAGTRGRSRTHLLAAEVAPDKVDDERVERAERVVERAQRAREERVQDAALEETSTGDAPVRGESGSSTSTRSSS